MIFISVDLYTFTFSPGAGWESIGEPDIDITIDSSPAKQGLSRGSPRRYSVQNIFQRPSTSHSLPMMIFNSMLLLLLRCLLLLQVSSILPPALGWQCCRRWSTSHRATGGGVVLARRLTAIPVTTSSANDDGDAVTPRSSSTSSDDALDDDVTSEVLELRFRDVWSHFQQQQQQQQQHELQQQMVTTLRNISDNTANDATTNTETTTNQTNNSSNIMLQQIQRNLLRTRHVNLHIHRCCVKQSTIPNAGKGVFATRNIQQNELITLYPGDALIQWDNASHVDDRNSLSIVLGSHIATTTEEQKQQQHIAMFAQGMDFARLYEVRISDYYSVIGDPQQCHDPAYLGHMINDCACITDTTTSTSTIVRNYLTTSLRGANAQIKVGTLGCHVEIVALKPIAAGNEIFLSYGANYWLSRRQRQQPITTTTTTNKSPTTTTTSSPIDVSSSNNNNNNNNKKSSGGFQKRQQQPVATTKSSSSNPKKRRSK